MSIFGDIMSAIFGAPKASATTAAPGATRADAPASSSMSAGMPSSAPVTPMSKAEVEGMIANIASQQSSKYNWQESIVDLMKLLKLDSSLTARKQLAQELGYTGALDGSAEMNLWLHKEVMARLASGGGKFKM